MSEQDAFERILASLHEARLDDTHWPVTGGPEPLREERVDLVKERWNFEEQRTNRRHALAPPVDMTLYSFASRGCGNLHLPPEVSDGLRPTPPRVS